MFNSILLFILDLILAAVAYFLYIGVFIPQISKNNAYNRLKAKEREELDRKLELERYFGEVGVVPAVSLAASGVKTVKKWFKKKKIDDVLEE